jgi:hypothetical protein
MKDRGTLNPKVALNEVYLTANEPQIHVEKVSHSIKILDAESIPARLEKVIKKCENLNPQEQHQLLQVLQKYRTSL